MPERANRYPPVLLILVVILAAPWPPGKFQAFIAYLSFQHPLSDKKLKQTDADYRAAQVAGPDYVVRLPGVDERPRMNQEK